MNYKDGGWGMLNRLLNVAGLLPLECGGVCFPRVRDGCMYGNSGPTWKKKTQQSIHVTFLFSPAIEYVEAAALGHSRSSSPVYSREGQS